MNDSVRAWLAARDQDVPAPLRSRILAAVDAVPGDQATLLDAAVAGLRRSFALRPGRSAAPDLLAADALLTWVCEEAVQQGDDALTARTAETCDRLTQLLAESGE